MQPNILLILVISIFIQSSYSIQLDIHIPLNANRTSCVYQLAMRANYNLNRFSLEHGTHEEIQFVDVNDEDNDDDDDNDNNDDHSHHPIPHVTLFLTDFHLEKNNNHHQTNNDINNLNQTLLDEFINTIQSSICSIITSKLYNKKSSSLSSFSLQHFNMNNKYNNIQIQNPIINSHYAMYQIINKYTIHQLSNIIVQNTNKFIYFNQSIPDWIYDITNETLRNKKIMYVKKYGSPNVYDEYNPHVTIGYDDDNDDDNDNNNHDWDIEKERFRILNELEWNDCNGYMDEIRIGLVGDHGTVLSGDPIASFHLQDCNVNIFNTVSTI